MGDVLRAEDLPRYEALAKAVGPCPHCGSRDVAYILRGNLWEDVRLRARRLRGELPYVHYIPGDVVTYRWGDFFCRSCGQEFGVAQQRDSKEEG